MFKSIHKQLNFGQTKKKFSTVQKILILLILLSSAIVILETENEIFETNKEFFEYSKYFFGIIFTVEYLLRVFTAGYLKKYRGIGGRISYIFSFWTLVDLIAILPFFISLF